MSVSSSDEKGRNGGSACGGDGSLGGEKVSPRRIRLQTASVNEFRENYTKHRFSNKYMYFFYPADVSVICSFYTPVL